MKLYELVNEQDGSYHGYGFDSMGVIGNNINRFMNDVIRDCSTYIQEYPFFKGIPPDTAPPVPMFKKGIRTDRMPTDSSATSTAAFNKVIEEMTRISQARYKSTFATNNTKTASGYGDVHVVFPTNDCVLLYKEGLADSLEITDDFDAYVNSELNEKENATQYQTKYRVFLNNTRGKNITYEDMMSHFDDFPIIQNAILDSMYKLERRLNGYVKTKRIPKINPNSVNSTEIMIYGSHYYAILSSFITYKFGDLNNFLSKLKDMKNET